MIEVDLGVSLLDKKGPRYWALAVSLNRLSLISPRTCVLGQIFGSYDLGREYLGLTGRDCRRHGFTFHTPWGFARGDDAWRRVLRSRQKETSWAQWMEGKLWSESEPSDA